jgi:two-component system, cell cycle response regulator DivK
MKKVLIIDDHRDLRELLRAQISLKGFSAIGAKSAKEGIETAIAEKPDLILMDIMMPEMDGREATRILRQITETREIPIVAVTAMLRPSDLKSCIEAGCNDYISKPFTLEQLREKISALI